MEMVYYLILMLTAGVVLTVNLLTRKKERFSQIVLKVLSLVLAVTFIFRYMLGQDAIEGVYKLTSNVFTSKFNNFMAIMLTWLTYTSNLLIILYPFFNIKEIKGYVKFLALPIVILDIFFLNIGMSAIVGANAISFYSLRGILYACEVGLSFGLALFVLIKETNWKGLFKKKEKQNIDTDKVVKYEKYNSKFLKALSKTFSTIIGWLKKHYVAIVLFFIVILSTVPTYAIQGLFGYINGGYGINDFDMPHRIILYGAILIPIAVHLALKRQDFDVKKFALLFICLGTLITFSINYRFDRFLDITAWPIHLCNTAMYIMPIVLIFKMKRFFYFTYFVNVAGALFAMLMPDYDGTLNMVSSQIVLFYVNHYIAFFMPLLFISLGMFDRPKFKQFAFAMLGFSCYFILVLIINAIFTGLYEVGRVSSTTDFFFTNSDFVADKLGRWCENLRKNSVAIVKFRGINLTFYPLYQILFYLAYVGIGLICWFVYEQMHELTLTLRDIKRRKQAIHLDMLALSVKLNGRSFKEPMNPENNNKLILNNFSKKYGSSDVYAVKDANLEVVGGEIFGFLGPNGAGKSTIIKSIVGIQPITSGNIEVCGYDVATQSVQAKHEIGFVPDHYALYEKLTGREYINYIADLYNVPLKERNETINNLIERLNLKTAFDNQIKTYSHGMKQKIAIIAALVHNPKVWILDEPLTGLDPDSIFQVKECMKEHKEKGNIVFFSSHIIDVVERICDRIAIIKKGDIKVTKSIKEIEESGITLEDFYMNIISEDKK